jgi:tetratricopeptide (TPR) repeat protein
VTDEFPPGYRVITAAEAEERFAVSADIWYPYTHFTDEQEIRLYEGGLHVPGGVKSHPLTDWSPYNVIVDGDLVTDGDVRLFDYSSGHFVVVTGDLRARSVVLEGCPNVVVRGDLTATGGVLGRRGDDGGLLVVSGHTRAPVVLNLLYFNMEFGQPPEAVVCGDPDRTGRPVDFEDDEDLAAAAWPYVVGADGTVDDELVETALTEGRPVLRPGAKPPHLAAEAELDALLERADEVTVIDLSERRLRGFPEKVLRFPNLRRLSLAGNDSLGTIPKAIATLTALEKLDLSDTGLRKLPKAIGALRRLRVLDLSDNRFERLPDTLGDLAELRVLRIRNLSTGFPAMVTRLPELRVLDLTLSRLGEVPDDLLRLSTLEELYLDGALGGVERLPELAELPRLRVLRVDGSSGNAGRYPSRDLLDGIWDITTLEDLGVDRWSEQKGRPALVLPADAFARTPRLKRVDLSFNPIETLPDPFYRLTDLEFVDLQYTKLDGATLDRIAATFPRVRMDLRHVDARSDVDDPTWRRVNDLVKAGAKAAADGRYEESVATLQQAVDLCRPGARYSDYDHLYARYSIVDSLGRLGDGDRLIGHAEAALAEVPAAIWHFTDLGAFQEEVLRRCGNALAWYLMERGDLDRALSTVERALTVAGSGEHDYIRDTKVRILLRLGRADDAYVVVDQVLARDPHFADFADLRETPEYLRRREARSVDPSAEGGVA